MYSFDVNCKKSRIFVPLNYFGAIRYRNPAMIAKTIFGSHRATAGGRVSV